MPVIKVWCLPEIEEKRLKELHQAIVQAVCGVPELGLRNQNDMTTLFPADLMKYGLGTDILVEITHLDVKPNRTHRVHNRLARLVGQVVKEFFPKAKVECSVDPFDHRTQGFWCSDAMEFQNPTGNWSYEGPFQVHLTDDATFDKMPDRKNVQVDGTIITVGDDPAYAGRIEQGRGGIQLYAGDQPFYFGYKYLIRLTKPDGELIWENKQL